MFGSDWNNILFLLATALQYADSWWQILSKILVRHEGFFWVASESLCNSLFLVRDCGNLSRTLLQKTASIYLIVLLVSCIFAAWILIDLWYWIRHSAAFDAFIWSIVYSICEELLSPFFPSLSIWPFQASTRMVMPFMFLCRALLLMRRFFSALMQEVELASMSPVKCLVYLWSREVMFSTEHIPCQCASFLIKMMQS